MNAERIHPMITAHKHIPAMHQCNRLDDCQPQTVVVATVAARRIDPVEALEQSRQVLTGNRRSRVGDADADLMLFDFDPHLRIATDLDLNLGILKNEILILQRGRHFVGQ